MNKLYHKTDKDNYDINALKKVIDLYKIGTIFLSEIDNIVKKRDRDIPEKDLKIYNSWSVAGLIGEGIDYTELTCGKSNKYVKPVIKKSLIDTQKMEFIDKLNHTYDVIFLNKIGIHTYMNSICPVLNDTDDIVFKKFEGRITTFSAAPTVHIPIPEPIPKPILRRARSVELEGSTPIYSSSSYSEPIEKFEGKITTFSASPTVHIPIPTTEFNSSGSFSSPTITFNSSDNFNDSTENFRQMENEDLYSRNKLRRVPITT
jgi:hypothetical protein